MAYDPAIPGPNDLLSQSQDDIQQNFESLNTFLNVNHVDFDDIDQGKHKWVTFPEQSGTPTFDVGELGLYNKEYAVTTVNELFINKQDGTQVPVTASAQSATGWCYLPSGLIMKWGTGTANGDTLVTFPTGATIPAFTHVFNIQITSAPASGSDSFAYLVAASITAVNFHVYGTARSTVATTSTPFYYLAMGN